MHLATYYDGISLHRRDKAIYAKLLIPHLVLSTCRVSGGMQRDLWYVLNHQSCEPANHRRPGILGRPKEYQRRLCTALDLPPERCATMGTAANMHHAAFVRRSYGELEVVAVVTGGVETNAGRAGDPASVLETEHGFERLQPAGDPDRIGTINTMLFISQPLTEAALTRAIMMATEGKCAALQELAVNSRYSDGLATGTGTDQIIVSAVDRPGYRLSWAGKHSKLGELIGQAVLEGVKETLAKQHGLTPQGQCSAKIHLERFGCSTASLCQGIIAHLPREFAALAADNLFGLLRDPVTAAAVMALVHVRDKFAWSILPGDCWHEIMGASAAQVACAVAGRYDRMDRYRTQLAAVAGDRPDNQRLVELCCRAMALGFVDKWEEGVQA